MRAASAVDLTRWEKDPKSPYGYMRVAGRLTWEEAYVGLARALGPAVDEYISAHWEVGRASGEEKHQVKPGEQLPEVRCVKSWAIEGSSEGHYVHVELLVSPDDFCDPVTVPFAIIKTFRGEEHAWALARQCWKVLQP